MSEFRSSYPFVAFPSWILKKQIDNPGWLSAKEIAILIALQSFADGMKHDSNVYPSIEKLCAMTSLCRRTVMDSIKDLQLKGLIEKTARYENGERKTNIYTLKLWNHASPLQENAVSGESHLGAKSALTPDPKCKKQQTLGAGFAHELEPLNNNHINPPISPLETPAPQPPTTSGKFQATDQAIPPDLKFASNLICNFFNKHKAGAKTQKSFAGLLVQLQKILKDPGGGIQQVKGQLQSAIQKSEMGEKKWNSITYENWQRFGKQKNAAWQNNNRPSTELHVDIFEEDRALAVIKF
jgi:hypothetical protein